MKGTIKLSEAERYTLQQLSVNHRHRDIRTRAAGLLLLDNGTRLWTKQGLCGLLSGHGGGRPSALTEAMLAKAMEVARTESMTLGQIAKHIEAVLGEPMPCVLETLSVALRRNGFSFKRNRFSLRKSGIRRTLR